MAKLSLFCYGTLISSFVREKILGCKSGVIVKKAYLHGYAVMTVAETHYPTLITAGKKQIVSGVLVSGLTDMDLSILDQFEGVNYSRKTRTVSAEDGSLLNPFVYLPNKFLETAGPWVFEDWESKQLKLFLSKDFDLSGIRRPN